MTIRVLLLLLISFSAQAGLAQRFESASEAVMNMGLGWNLGNTLDSHQAGLSDATKTEILREQCPTRPELMTMLHEAGFGAVRVPVTWYPHLSADGTIDTAWMSRVKAVVDYVINAGMYCIINVHHDGNYKNSTTFPDGPWIKATMANYTANKAAFMNLWTQIATAFRDYDDRLLFEGYSELLDSHNSWNYASFGCEDKYDADVAADAYAAINSYAQSFVDAVRATGGNNKERNLVISTYATCAARGSWSEHLTEPLISLAVPNDEAANHIIAEVHTYPRIADTDDEGERTPRDWAEYDTEISTQFDNLTTHLIDRGMPVIIGEWGSSNVDAATTDYDVLRDHYLDFVADYVARAKAANIALFYWMGVSDRLGRSLPVFTEPDVAAAMLKAYHGEDFYPALPTIDDYDTPAYKATYLAQYGELLLAKFEAGQGDYTKITIEFSEKPQRGRLQLRTYYSSESVYTSTTVNSVFTVSQTFKSDGTQASRVVLKYSSASLGTTPIIKRAYLTKSDGTTVDVVPQKFSNCYLELTANPLFDKINVSEALYTSLYYGDRQFVVPDGMDARAYQLTDGRLVRVKTYEAGDVLPKATGLVLRADAAGTYLLRHTDEAGEEPQGNMLRGSDTAETTTGGDTYYMLSLNSALDINSAGFYYKYADGGAFINDAHKAYLAVPAAESLASRYVFSEATDEPTTTGISSLSATPRAELWHTLDGRRLPTAPTCSGVYLHNGQKVVLR